MLLSLIGDDAVADDYASIAMYFENQKQHFLAGKFFLKSKQYAKVSRQLEVHVCVNVNCFLPNNVQHLSKN